MTVTVNLGSLLLTACHTPKQFLVRVIWIEHNLFLELNAYMHFWAEKVEQESLINRVCKGFKRWVVPFFE